MKLYTYAVIKNERTDKDGETTEPAKIVVTPTTILARDDAQANLMAARAIPDTELDDVDRLVIVVRPF